MNFAFTNPEWSYVIAFCLGVMSYFVWDYMRLRKREAQEEDELLNDILYTSDFRNPRCFLSYKIMILRRRSEERQNRGALVLKLHKTILRLERQLQQLMSAAERVSQMAQQENELRETATEI